MDELNVEKIMEEIRDEIKEKGYTNDMLSFDDITLEDIGIDVEEFDWARFSGELMNLNSIWNVNPNREIESKHGLKGKFITLFKKFIRKCIRFYMAPIVYEQDAFNATAVRLFNMVNCFVEENMRLTYELEKLKAEQGALKKEIHLLGDKLA